MTPEQAAALRDEFPPEEVGQLPKAGKMFDYVGHAAARLRLLDVDSEWNWEPVGTDERGLPVFDADASGNPIGLWIRLTVGGVTRLGYGSCPSTQFDAEKVLIGDAIRNAAMSFGVATYLWVKGHSGDEELSDGPRNREAPAPAAEVGFMGFPSREVAKAEHDKAASLWRTIPDELRPEIPKVWPTTREGLDAFNAQINAALATALGASESADGPNTPPVLSEAESSAHGEPELPPAGARSVDTPDIDSISHEADIEGPSVFNGDTGHCAHCGAAIWYDRDHWNHADPSDDPFCPRVASLAGPEVDVDALYAGMHADPPVDLKITELKVKTEVGKMSGPKVIEALTAAGLSTAGPPPKLKERLVEHRLSVLANTP